DMVRIGRQLRVLWPDRCPIGAEMKFSVGMRKTVEKMAGLETRAAIEPAVLQEAVRFRKPADSQSSVDHLDGAHRKAGVARPETIGEPADHVVVGAALSIGIQYRAADLQVSVGARWINIVMLEERRCRQYDIGHRRGLGHELFVDADKQIGARKT